MIERIVELYMYIIAVRPTRIVMLTNHMDMVGVCGAWPFRDIVEFIHHADHMPALGASLPYSAHVDLTHTCHLACCDAGINPIWAGMTVPIDVTPPVNRTRNASTVMATCGSMIKYRHPQRSYQSNFLWTDYAVAALKAHDGVLLHMGPTDEAIRAEVFRALAVSGIDPDRYSFVGPVENLRRELLTRQVDVYLCSYPQAGGRSNLEAMSAGIPVIVPFEPALGPLLECSFPLEGWLRIAAPNELESALRRASDLKITMQSPQWTDSFVREMSHFDDYVAGSSFSPVSVNQALESLNSPTLRA